MRDHKPITVDKFSGDYNRGGDTATPVDHFVSSLNIRFVGKEVETREGFAESVTIASTRRIADYKRQGEATRLLLLRGDGNLYDSLNLATPILSIPAMSDFSAVSYNGRVYITPHNGVSGLPGEFVYVYEGSGVARKAAGSPPGTSLVAADSAFSGNVEAGMHAYAVAYETTTGFITGFSGYTTLTSAGAKQVDLSDIAVGPAGTAARRIVATVILETFDGNYDNLEWFFVPNGRIANNVDTTATINFYDADLVSSADYLQDQLEEIPAGVGFALYKNRLIVYGEDANRNVARVSRSGELERFDSAEGYLTANAGDPNSTIQNCFSYRTLLVIGLSQGFFTTSDNGEEAVYWKIDDLDSSVGTSSHGVGIVLGVEGKNVRDRAVIADRGGLQLFQGTFAESDLTSDIEDTWARINQAAFHKVEVAIDPINFLIYVAVPLDAATSPSHVLVGDYTNGLDNVHKVRWTTWQFPVTPSSIIVSQNTTTKKPIMTFGGYTGNVYVQEAGRRNDFGSAIDSYVEFALLPLRSESAVFHFGGYVLDVSGSGSMVPSVRNKNSTKTATLRAITLEASPSHNLRRGMNFRDEKMSLKLRTNAVDAWFRLASYVQYFKLVWLNR